MGVSRGTTKLPTIRILFPEPRNTLTPAKITNSIKVCIGFLAKNLMNLARENLPILKTLCSSSLPRYIISTS